MFVVLILIYLFILTFLCPSGTNAEAAVKTDFAIVINFVVICIWQTNRFFGFSILKSFFSLHLTVMQVIIRIGWTIDYYLKELRLRNFTILATTVWHYTSSLLTLKLQGLVCDSALLESEIVNDHPAGTGAVVIFMEVRCGQNSENCMHGYKMNR